MQIFKRLCKPIASDINAIEQGHMLVSAPRQQRSLNVRPDAQRGVVDLAAGMTAAGRQLGQRAVLAGCDAAVKKGLVAQVVNLRCRNQFLGLAVEVEQPVGVAVHHVGGVVDAVENGLQVVVCRLQSGGQPGLEQEGADQL